MKINHTVYNDMTIASARLPFKMTSWPIMICAACACKPHSDTCLICVTSVWSRTDLSKLVKVLFFNYLNSFQCNYFYHGLRLSVKVRSVSFQLPLSGYNRNHFIFSYFHIGLKSQSCWLLIFTSSYRTEVMLLLLRLPQNTQPELFQRVVSLYFVVFWL